MDSRSLTTLQQQQQPANSRHLGRDETTFSNPKRLIDLFAGAGGLSVGFEDAGFRAELAVEDDKWVAETFSHNKPHCLVLQRDIRTLSDLEIKALLKDEIDIIVGGPPCQGFSHANTSQKDSKDPRNSLFRDFVRFASVIQPKMCVIENVPGLLSSKLVDGTLAIEAIVRAFDLIKYRAEYRVLSAFSPYRTTAANVQMEPTHLDGLLDARSVFFYQITMISSEVDGGGGRQMASGNIINSGTVVVKLPRGAKYEATMHGKVEITLKDKMTNITPAQGGWRFSAPLDTSKDITFEVDPGKVRIGPSRKGVQMIDPTASWVADPKPYATPDGGKAGGNFGFTIDVSRSTSSGGGLGGLSNGISDVTKVTAGSNIRVEYIEPPKTKDAGGG